MRLYVLFVLLALTMLFVSCGQNAAQKAHPKATPQRMTPQDANEMEQVKQFVASYQSQLTKIYSRHSAIIAQHGTLQITLYINEKGSVADTIVEPKSGRFSTALLRDVKNKTLEWKFTNKNKLVYTFSLRLSKD